MVMRGKEQVVKLDIHPIEAMLPERLRITSLLQKPEERNAKVELERKVYYN